MTGMPPSTAAPPSNLKPHRGTAVLVLGILGIVVCVICGVIAWVMGSNDLKEMEAGIMDPSGMGITKAGKICGMISCILAIIGVGLWLIIMIVAMVAGASGAG